jgi:hypothetical protein
VQFVAGTALAILYLALCMAVVLIVGVPAALVLGSVAAAVGAVGALALITSAFVGETEDRDLPADEGVAAHVLPGRPGPVEPAWRHYLSRQWSLDVRAAYNRVENANSQVWRAVHGVVGDAFGEVPFVLWPLAWVPYVVTAAATAGAAVAGAVTAAVVGVPATLVWLLRTGWVRVLRRRERSRQQRRRAAATCTAEGCDDMSDKPVVECACGRRHHRLEPGRFGAFRRRCTCGRLLPTTVTAAARTLPLRCPRCDRRLLEGAMVDADIRIAVLGAPGSGRTELVRAGLDDLRDTVSSRGGSFDEIGPTDAPAAVDRVCRSVRIVLRRHSASVHVHDPIGDALDVPTRRRRLHHLRHAQGFLLVVDAPALPRLAGTVPGVGAVVDPEHSYRTTVAHLRDDRVDPGRRTLAVVLRRLGTVAAAGIDVPPDDATSATIRAWLVSVGAENLVVAADRDFGSVRYFGPGASIEPEARAAGTALAWLVGNSGFTVPTPRPPKP